MGTSKVKVNAEKGVLQVTVALYPPVERDVLRTTIAAAVQMRIDVTLK